MAPLEKHEFWACSGYMLVFRGNIAKDLPHETNIFIPSISISPWCCWCCCQRWRCWCRRSNLLWGRFGHEDKVWDLESNQIHPFPPPPGVSTTNTRLKWKPKEKWHWRFGMIFEVSAVRFSGFTPSFRISFYLNGLPAWGARRCIWIQEVHLGSLLYRLRGHVFAGWEIIERKFQLRKLIYFSWNFEGGYTGRKKYSTLKKETIGILDAMIEVLLLKKDPSFQ